jgi:hypothetical protein
MQTVQPRMTRPSRLFRSYTMSSEVLTASMEMWQSSMTRQDGLYRPTETAASYLSA